MKILSVVAHPDDEVIGVGGTLARHVSEGDDVHVCILSDGVNSRYDSTKAADPEVRQRRNHAQKACQELGVSVNFHDFPDNRFDSVPILDIIQTIEDEMNEISPEIVYTHHYGDLNVDHELTCRATVTATRPLKDSTVMRLLGFETLSSTEWSIPDSGKSFQPTSFVEINDHLETKLSTLKHYEEELREMPHPRSVEIIRKNAEVWGAKAGMAAAEPFEVLREVVF